MGGGELHEKSATKRQRILETLMFPGLDLESPWLLNGSPGYNQCRRLIITTVWRPRKDYHPPKRKRLASGWADPESQHTKGTVDRPPALAT